VQWFLLRLLGQFFFSLAIIEFVDLRLYPPVLSAQPNTFHMQTNQLQLLIFLWRRRNKLIEAGPTFWGLVSCRDKRCFLFSFNLQTGSVTHPACCSIGTGTSMRGEKDIKARIRRYISIWCRSSELVELYLYSPYSFNGVGSINLNPYLCGKIKLSCLRYATPPCMEEENAEPYRVSNFSFCQEE